MVRVEKRRIHAGSADLNLARGGYLDAGGFAAAVASGTRFGQLFDALADGEESLSAPVAAHGQGVGAGGHGGSGPDNRVPVEDLARVLQHNPGGSGQGGSL